MYTWLHYCQLRKGILCFYCAKYFMAQNPRLASKADPMFIKRGFTNWRKAVEKFSAHQNSQCHKLAMMTRIHEAKPVNVQLERQIERQQQEARRNLMKIVEGVKFSGRQGIAFRGHEKESGNFIQLMKYKAKGDAELTTWLDGDIDFTSPQIQNELLKLMANTIVKRNSG